MRSEAEIYESEIERYFIAQVKARGGWSFKFVIRGFRGLPDRLNFMPEGRLLLCEVKRPRGGRVSTIQKYVHKKLRELGFPVYLANTRGRIDEVFEDFDKRHKNLFRIEI